LGSSGIFSEISTKTVGSGRRFFVFESGKKDRKNFNILPFEYLIMADGYDMIVPLCGDKFRQDPGCGKEKGTAVFAETAGRGL